MRRPLCILSLLLTFVCAGSAFAQDPRPPMDTARAMQVDSAGIDSASIGRDTLSRGNVMQDSVRALPQLAKHYFDPATGFGSGVWHWSRDSLMLEAPVTLGDLLERLPGVLTFRSGFYGQPEAASALGGTANRLEVWLDGFILDPLLEASFDVSKFELANVESVRVERRMGTIRVHIETLMPATNRAYSMVEAAVGEPDANLFRGVFLAPKVLVGPLNLAVDRIDSDGLGGAEATDQFAGWAKWSYVRPSGTGLQVEFRRITTDREPASPYAAKWTRDDLIIRARARLLDGLVAEIFGGRTALEVDTITSAENDSAPRFNAENIQWGARASFVSPIVWARGSFRARDHAVLPSVQFDAAAGATYGAFNAAAEMTQSNWRESESATELTLRAEAGPFGGLRVFGESTTSNRGAPFMAGFVDSVSALALVNEYKGLRAGGQFEWRGMVAAGALLKAKTDSAITFGLPFDQQRRFYFGSDATGWEIMGRLPIPWFKPLALTGTVTDWYSGHVTLYMPTRIYRAGADLHWLPLKSGNLEIMGRIEMIHRGAMLVPNFGEPGESDPDEPITTLPVESIDAYLQIRIMSVRAFLRVEDMDAKNVEEIPGRALRGPRIFYGVKWEFSN